MRPVSLRRSLSLFMRSTIVLSIAMGSLEARIPMSSENIFSPLADMQSHSFVMSKPNVIKNLFLNLDRMNPAVSISLFANISWSSDQFMNIALNLHAHKHSPHPTHFVWSMKAFSFLKDMALTGQIFMQHPQPVQFFSITCGFRDECRACFVGFDTMPMPIFFIAPAYPDKIWPVACDNIRRLSREPIKEGTFIFLI